MILGILAMLVMVGVGTLVGVRLRRLGRRTRQLPERVLGAGLLCVTAGAGVAALGRIPALFATDVGDAMLGGGLAVTMCGLSFFCVFTWRVFRPDSLWALLLVMLAAGAMGAQWLGLMRASLEGGATLAAVLPHTRPWAIAIVSTLIAVSLWSGLESGAYHRRMQRQRAIGLGDFVLENRFALWSISGFGVALLCAAMVGSMLAGLAPLRHPLPLWCIGLCAVVVSATWTLTFLPPRRYLDWLQTKAPGARAPGASSASA